MVRVISELRLTARIIIMSGLTPRGADSALPQEMRRNLLSKLYAGDAGRAVVVAIPGRSARGCCASCQAVGMKVCRRL
jgi:hypothetical protein